jgi:RHS repeat-associated protein
MKLAYLYDAAGNRVVKDHYATDTTTHTTRTYYVRDAQGNVMGIFKRAMSGYDIERKESPIYGSTRLGVAYKGALHTTGVVDTLAHHNAIYTRALRQRGYELTDHLGNVRATVSDMLIPRGGSVFDADLRTLTDYYPFGMQMPERTYEAGGIAGHRYGFNGKENDDDVKGEGNSLDYGARIYDPRVARWLSVDPLSHQYPSTSAFVFSLNTPLQAFDPDGRLVLFVNGLRPMERRKPGFYRTDVNKYWGSFAQEASKRIADNNLLFADANFGLNSTLPLSDFGTNPASPLQFYKRREAGALDGQLLASMIVIFPQFDLQSTRSSRTL